MDRKLGKVVWPALVLLGAFSAPATFAAKNSGNHPTFAQTEYWLAEVDMDASLFNISVDGNSADAYEEARKADAALEEGLDKAMAEAKRVPAVLAAVQAFHVAAHSYFTNGTDGRITAKRLKIEFDRQADALRLAIKAANL